MDGLKDGLIPEQRKGSFDEGINTLCQQEASGTLKQGRSAEKRELMHIRQGPVSWRKGLAHTRQGPIAWRQAWALGVPGSVSSWHRSPGLNVTLQQAAGASQAAAGAGGRQGG